MIEYLRRNTCTRPYISADPKYLSGTDALDAGHVYEVSLQSVKTCASNELHNLWHRPTNKPTNQPIPARWPPLGDSYPCPCQPTPQPHTLLWTSGPGMYMYNNRWNDLLKWPVTNLYGTTASFQRRTGSRMAFLLFLLPLAVFRRSRPLILL